MPRREHPTNEMVLAVYNHTIFSPPGTCWLDYIPRGPGGIANANDIDIDGVDDACDNCAALGYSNPWQEDEDGDACDLSPLNPATCGSGGGGSGAVTPPVPLVDQWMFYTGGGATLGELHFYGIAQQGRIGMYLPDVPRDTLAVSLPTYPVYTRELRKRRYELKDHLGNENVILTDLKLAGSSGAGLAPWLPDVVAYNNYYSFGMLQPNRSWQSDGYRYGYNGKEMDNEERGTGNSVDYGFRMYDPRVARFMSVDPLEAKFANLTPYQYSSNTPIWAIDYDGLEAYIYQYRLINQVAGQVSFIRKLNNLAIMRIGGVLVKWNVAKNRPSTGEDDITEQYQYYDNKGKRLKVRRDYDGSIVAGDNELIRIHYNKLWKFTITDAYPGDRNPTYHGDPDYRREPKSLVDEAGLHHDQAYDHLGATGSSDAFNNLLTLDADKKLVDDCESVIKGWIMRKIDPWTGEHISGGTYLEADVIVRLFSYIVAEKEARKAIQRTEDVIKDALTPRLPTP